MFSHWFFWLFVFLFVTHETVESLLILLNVSHTKKQTGRIPGYFKDKITPENYEKSIRYTVERNRYALATSLIEIPIVWGSILGGFFSCLDLWLLPLVSGASLTHSVIYCVAIGLFLMFLKIPFSLYSHFVLEAKFGFNRMTGKTFILDFFKSLLLSALLGIPLLYLVFWFYSRSGSLWWLMAFGVLGLFEFFIHAVYPVLLAPLFNKFVPLADGELKTRIIDIAKKIGFKMSGIFTIDGSRRSSHSNAYFAGMGKMRRIVLFDTLMQKHTTAEIVSVLAHEMGHNIKRHVLRNWVMTSFLSLAGFWILSIVIDWPPFYAAFGAGNPAPHKALVLFALFSGTFTFVLTPLMNAISRKYEYEADRFSVEVTGEKGPMAAALVKLSEDNLTNLTPHPLYSFTHYSHPTTLERIRVIQA